MPDPIIYSFIPPILNKPVHGLLETGRTIRTSKIVMLEESRTADFLGVSRAEVTATPN
jgi:hypothetical protein